MLEWHRNASPDEVAELEEAYAWCGTSRFHGSQRPSYDPWTGQGLQVLLTRAIAEAIAQRALPPEVHGELVVHVTTSAEGQPSVAIATTPTVPPAVRAIATRAFTSIVSAPTVVSQAAHLLRY
jgi:hypothetical protein